MYAIISTGGKQYRVKENDLIDVEFIGGEVGAKVSFDKVMAVGEGEKVQYGAPVVKGAKVEGEIIKQFRGEKLIAFKYKKRKGYEKKKGHRQELTRIKISAVTC